MFKIVFLVAFLNFLNFPFIITFVDFDLRKSELVSQPGPLIQIQTRLGGLVGYKKRVLNKTINVYYGIPYTNGQPERFKKAKLIQKFPTNPYLATQFKPHCPLPRDFKRYNPNDTFSEDCLYLNVFSPNLEGIKSKDGKCSKKFNVMLFVYGTNSSAFQIFPIVNKNNPNPELTYSGDIFAALEDTILITFNHRQRLFSSFFLEGEFPANLALFDQHLAIQWVKNNIQDFCGSNELTMFGVSYGGNYVSIHLLSNYSKGLINNAIIQSGFGLFTDTQPVTKNEMIINSVLAANKLECLDLCTRFTSDDLKSLRKKTKLKFFENDGDQYVLKDHLFIKELDRNLFRKNLKLRTKINFLNEDDYISKDVLAVVKLVSRSIVNIKCLQNASIDDVINLRFHNSRSWQLYYDFDFIDKQTYLDYKLFNKLNLNPNVNILIGGRKNEVCKSIDYIDKYYNDQFNAPVMPKSDAKDIIKELIPLFKGNQKLSSHLADYYTNETLWSLSNGYTDSLNNLLTDYSYACSHHFYSIYAAMSKANSVYSYVISKEASKHILESIVKYDQDNFQWLNNCHADEIVYLFGLPFSLEKDFTDLDRRFSMDLIEIWASFAKTGKMVKLSNGENWPKSTEHDYDPKYVEINGKFLRRAKFEFEDRCKNFWRPLLPFYKR